MAVRRRRRSALGAQAVLLHLVDQRDARDAEPAGGLGLIAAGGVEGAGDQTALERLDLLLERGAAARVDRGGIAVLVAGVVGLDRDRRRGRRALAGGELVVGQADHAAGGQRGEPRDRVLELADVAGAGGADQGRDQGGLPAEPAPGAAVGAP